MTRWEAGDLPKAVALPGTGGSVRGYPALVDEGATVGVRVLETPAAQRAAMHAGTRKLLALDMPSPIRHLQGRAERGGRARPRHARPAATRARSWRTRRSPRSSR